VVLVFGAAVVGATVVVMTVAGGSVAEALATVLVMLPSSAAGPSSEATSAAEPSTASASGAWLVLSACGPPRVLGSTGTSRLRLWARGRSSSGPLPSCTWL